MPAPRKIAEKIMKNVISAIAILALAVVSVNATIINIPGDYTTIQEGIDHSSDSDTVLVQPDTYHENLNFNGHNVVLASLFLTTGDTAYISTTIVDGDSSRSIVAFENGEDTTAQVVGFTIRNGFARYGGGIHCQSSSPTITWNIVIANSADSAGGGLFCRASDAIIASNRVSGNSAFVGGGVCCWDSDPQISGSTIIGNSAAGAAGGVYCWQSDASVSGNDISGNTVVQHGIGAGVFCRECSPTITDNIITGNHGYSGGAITGAGIACWLSDATIVNNSINGNAASNGGGIFCSSSSPMIDGNDISENEVIDAGGGIYSFNSRPSIVNNTINGNTVDYNHGGGIYCDSSDATIESNVLGGNAARYGGGIYCIHSDPSMGGNTISDNSADKGGGIYCCSNSSPDIRNNVITNNSTSHEGGGVFCRDQSDPEINANSISGNSAVGGGGVCCWSSSPTISGNTIRDNSVFVWGGGIQCDSGDPIVTGNIISSNRAGSGGGVFCVNSTTALISDNLITGNCADTSGGGVSCWWYAGPTITDNTFSRNWGGRGGAIDCSSSSPTITDCILWGDTSPAASEIYVWSGSPPTVSYCDVQGGWPGTGNLDEDPLFIGPEKEDYQIRWHSPCIDAGDPNSPLDPDGTRSDMGVFYFNQDVVGIVEVYPHHAPIIIPPHGGDVVYDGWVFNFLGRPGRADIWTYAFVPGVGRYGPIDLYRNIRIPADSIGMNNIGQHVPGQAPAGDYVFVAYTGKYPGTVIDSSYFYFTKNVSIGEGKDNWTVAGGWLNERGLTASNLPGDYSLSQNYPNPFNAETIIDYQLPVEGHVRVEIYNTLGQKVATLADRKQQAGYRSVIWDASEVSSGLYFYRLSAGDYSETRRMMLVK